MVVYDIDGMIYNHLFYPYKKKFIVFYYSLN